MTDRQNLFEKKTRIFRTMKNPLLEFVTKSNFVNVKKDIVDGRIVTRMIVESDDLPKLSNGMWMAMNILDFFSGFYGYRITISGCQIKIKFQ